MHNEAHRIMAPIDPPPLFHQAPAHVGARRRSGTPDRFARTLPLTSAVLLVMMLMLVGISGCAKKDAAPPQGGALPVSVAVVEQKDVPIYGEGVANLDGYTNAAIQPQVSGYLVRQNYQEGSVVHKGQVLFEIDPRPFQAVLDQAKGQLAQAEAQRANADMNVKRDVPEADAHAIPQSQLDNDTQALLAARAEVEADQ